MAFVLAEDQKLPETCPDNLFVAEIKFNFAVDVQEYAIYTSALIVLYRMLTRSRLMSPQVGGPTEYP